MCTGIRFTSENNTMYFARNLDWSFSYGEQILVTPRNFERKYAFGAQEKSKYSIIGMGIVAENFPLYFDCANEEGLAIGGLNFPGYASYEDRAIEGKTNIAAYEFPLWVVSNFASVDEVELALQEVAIIAKPINDAYPVSLLHWMIADATRSIVVEYEADGMHIYHNDIDVLANQPRFSWHCENLRNYISLTNATPEEVMWGRAKLEPYGSGSGMRGLPGDYYSPSRFVRAAYLNAHYPCQKEEAENVARMFHVLGSVSMIDGAARMLDGNFEKTIYTGGYSARTKNYYYRTYNNPLIRSAGLDDFNPDSDKLILTRGKLMDFS